MTTILVTAGACIAVAAGAWLLGDLIARWSGVFCTVVGTGYMIGGRLAGLAMLAVGIVLWVVGHWLYAWKFHVWRSALAQRLFTTTRLARIDPTRGWVLPVAEIRQMEP